eukprot:scaffold1973_cov399-Prasinococcus_capsulatus_cf.AAC.27
MVELLRARRRAPAYMCAPRASTNLRAASHGLCRWLHTLLKMVSILAAANAARKPSALCGPLSSRKGQRRKRSPVCSANYQNVSSPVEVCDSNESGHNQVNSLRRGGAAPVTTAESFDRRAALTSVAAVLLASQAQPAWAEGAPKVFVAGATGSTGSLVVEELVGQGYDVLAGIRSLQKAKETLGSISGDAKPVFVAAGRVTLLTTALALADVVESSVEELAQAMSGAEAVICATGFSPKPFSKVDTAHLVDNVGTCKLVDAAKMAGVKKFCLGWLVCLVQAMGQSKNPNFVVLNLFGGVLTEKHEAELYLRDSGLDYTIVRPGGLTNDPLEGYNIIVSGEDTLFGLDGDPGT